MEKIIVCEEHIFVEEHQEYYLQRYPQMIRTNKQIEMSVIMVRRKEKRKSGKFLHSELI